MNFGISLRYSSDPLGIKLSGLPCAAMSGWGLPKLFSDVNAASQYARQHYGQQYGRTGSKDNTFLYWDIVSARTATLCCGIQVEATNGRRYWDSTSQRWLINPAKLSYEQMLPLLLELAAKADRDKLRRENYQLRHKPFEYGKMSFEFEE